MQPCCFFCPRIKLFFRLCHEGDGLRVIQAINSQGANLRCLVILWRKFTANIPVYIALFLFFKQVKREGNKLVHALAR